MTLVLNSGNGGGSSSSNRGKSSNKPPSDDWAEWHFRSLADLGHVTRVLSVSRRRSICARPVVGINGAWLGDCFGYLILILISTSGYRVYVVWFIEFVHNIFL